MKFGPSEINNLKVHLEKGRSVKDTWQEYVEVCNGDQVLPVSSLEELAKVVCVAQAGTIILLKKMFWYELEVSGHTIRLRESLGSLFLGAPELLGLKVPKGLSLSPVENLSSIPYFLQILLEGSLADYRKIVVLIIDPDLYDQPAE